MYTTQTVENQEVLWLPTNDDTKTILYDTKFLKSSPGRYPPLRWTITKIEDTAIEGISKFTLAQDLFDPAKDNADDMIANYYEYSIDPEVPTVNDLEIVCSGAPAVRAGGGYKKFTLKQRVNDELVNVTEKVIWTIDFPNGGLDKLESIPKVNVLADNEFKVKCLPFYDLAGETFTITAESEHGSKSIIVEVTSL